MPTASSTRPKPDVNILDQRVPKNPKYEHIQPTIDTGDSLTKFLQRNEGEPRCDNQEEEGMFKRMKVSTLVRLIIQVAEINSLENSKHDEMESNRSQRTTTYLDRPQTDDSEMSTATSRSTLHNLISGMGEVDVYKNYVNRMSTTVPPTPKTPHSVRSNVTVHDNDCPYLIVDLRDADEFKENHIVSAHHYPAAMLSRCTNNDSKELLRYKNQKGKIIVLYDDDEHIAPKAATIMAERGYNNIFLLSGGLRHAIRKFPHGLLTGTCPLLWTLAHPPATSSRKQPHPELMDSGRHKAPIGEPFVHVPRPPPGPMITFEPREQFTVHDIEELNTRLESNLAPVDSGTRLSRSQTIASKQSSRVSNASNRSHFSHISDKPWKP